MSLGVLPVARKKGKPAEGPGPRKSPAPEPRKIVLAVRGRAEWKGWIDRLAEHDRASINDLIDRALVAYARQVGFKEGAPRR